jgi:drug/metabolite transporter (DMT)-like permease
VTTTTLDNSPATPWQTYSILMLGVLAVSVSSIFIRLAQGEGVPSLLIAAARLTIASLILTPLVLRRHRADMRRLTPRDRGLILLSGVFLALHFITWITSLEYTTVLVGTVLVTTSPLWTAFLERFFLGSRLGILVFVGLMVAIAGGVIISLPEDSTIDLGGDPLTGILLALTGALAVSVYLVIGRSVRARLPLLPYIWLVYSSAAIITCVILALTATPVTGYPTTGYLWVLGVALIPQLIGHSAFNYALEHLSATFVGITTQTEPIFAALMAFLVFDELPRLPQVLGSAIILFGVAVATLGQSRSTAKHDKKGT